jgi:hypothetical protein
MKLGETELLQEPDRARHMGAAVGSSSLDTPHRALLRSMLVNVADAAWSAAANLFEDLPLCRRALGVQRRSPRQPVALLLPSFR